MGSLVRQMDWEEFEKERIKPFSSHLPECGHQRQELGVFQAYLSSHSNPKIYTYLFNMI